MKKKCVFAFFASLLVLYTWGTGTAEVELSIQQTLKPEGEVADIAVSGNGKWIYILTNQGTIHVYGAEGDLQGTVRVNDSTDRIRIGSAEDTLILINRKVGSVQLARIDFIHDINVAGSPFKGPANAAVVLTVFSDFE
ncbi:MAG: hypothetical protein ACOWYE_18420 [Desulfatiglandales bacterium]